MCQHQYQVKLSGLDDNCYLITIVKDNNKMFSKSSLRLDEDGCCVFHSRNLIFKREAKFEEALSTLISIFIDDDQYNDVDLRDIYYNEEFSIFELKDLVLDKSVHLTGSNIQNSLVIKDVIASQSFYMDGCVVLGSCKIINSTFHSSFTAVDLPKSSTWYSTLTMRDVVFNGLCDFGGAHFYGQLDIKGVVFNGYTRLDNVLVKSEEDAFTYLQFRVTGNFDCRGASFHNIVHMEDCEFFGDSKFSNTQFYSSVYISKPVVAANLVFSGVSETERMFTDTVEFAISDSCFQDVGQISFENCNLTHLDKITKSRLSDLMAKRLFVLQSGTIAYRFSFEKEFEYSEANEIFIQDLLQTIRQYFALKFRKHFQITIKRIDQKIVIGIHTDDFEDQDKYLDCENQATKKLILAGQEAIASSVEKYLGTKFEMQLDGIVRQQMKDMEKTIISKLLSLENFKLYLDTNSVDMIAAKQLFIGDVYNSTFYIEKLNSLENDPIFNMDDSQFDLLKSQLLTLNRDEDWKELKRLMKAIQNAESKEEDLKDFLLSKGIATGDRIIASIIFVFVQYLLFHS